MNFWRVTRETEVYLNSEGTLRFFQHLANLLRRFSLSINVTIAVAVLPNCPHKKSRICGFTLCNIYLSLDGLHNICITLWFLQIRLNNNDINQT